MFDHLCTILMLVNLCQMLEVLCQNYHNSCWQFFLHNKQILSLKCVTNIIIADVGTGSQSYSLQMLAVQNKNSANFVEWIPNNVKVLNEHI